MAREGGETEKKASESVRRSCFRCNGVDSVQLPDCTKATL